MLISSFDQGMDPSFTRTIKLDILVSLCIDPKAIDAVLAELRTYVRHNDKEFVCASIRAVGKIAELARVVYDRRALTVDINATRARADADLIALNCLSGLVTLSEFSRNEMVVGECAVTMQRILAQLWSSDGDAVAHLVNDQTKIQERALKRLFLILARALSIDSDDEDEEVNEKHQQLRSRAVRVPDAAIAATLWIIGEWSTMQETIVSPWAVENSHKSTIRLEILRLLAKSFPEIDSQTKLQAIHLSSKILLMLNTDSSLSTHVDKEQAICEFILSMGRIDVVQDVRDRARFESGILQLSVGLIHDTAALPSPPDNASNSLNLEKAKSILLKQKPTASSLPLSGQSSDATVYIESLRFGTLSSIVGYKSSGSGQPLPEWADVDSPSSLRDQSLQHESKETKRDGIAGPSSGLYSSSSSSDESSSSDDSSSSGNSSSDSSDESESSSESSDDDDRGVLRAFASNEINNQTTVAPTNMMADTHIPSLLNKDSDGTSSSSSSSSSESDSSSDSESDNKGDSDSAKYYKNTPAVGTILDMSVASQPQTQTQYETQASNASPTIASGLEDLVMTPLVVDKNDLDKTANTNIESSAWIKYVKPELGGGLLVKMRYLRGSVKINECKMMGLDPENPSTVCLQVHIENK